MYVDYINVTIVTLGFLHPILQQKEILVNYMNFAFLLPGNIYEDITNVVNSAVCFMCFTSRISSYVQ